MLDRDVNWRNLRWAVDAEIIETESCPNLRALLDKYGVAFDDVYIYKFKTKGHIYIVRFPHWNSQRNDYHIPTERRKDPFQKKLLEVKKPSRCDVCPINVDVRRNIRCCETCTKEHPAYKKELVQ